MISNLLDRMKLPFRKNKEFLSALHSILGFYPHNIEIYRIALSHKSYRNNFDWKDKVHSRKKTLGSYSHPLNNERLEYLGDAVLEIVVSDILFRHFKHKREGFLTSTRAKLVKRETLNRLSSQMGINNLIFAANGTDTVHSNIGGNAFEALMGAIYLDRGIKYCYWFMSNRVFGHYINIDNMAQKEINFKSKLLEWSQKNRININYRDYQRSDESAGKGFGTVLTIEDIIVSRGEGRSKKESQQDASKEALIRMRRDINLYDSLFRAKEKRTAMEAEESFALPKIEEIEEEISISPLRNGKKMKKKELPILEEKKKSTAEKILEDAYDKAYDKDADYEIVDTPEEEQETNFDYVAKGLPAPPCINDIESDKEYSYSLGNYDSTKKSKQTKSTQTNTKNSSKNTTKEDLKATDKKTKDKQNQETKNNSKKEKKPSQQIKNTDVPTIRKEEPAKLLNNAENIIIVEDIKPVTTDNNNQRKKTNNLLDKNTPKTLEKTSLSEGDSLATNEEIGKSFVSKKDELVNLIEEKELKDKEDFDNLIPQSFESRKNLESSENDKLPNANGNEELEKGKDNLEKEVDTELSASISVANLIKTSDSSQKLQHLSLDDFVLGVDKEEDVPNEEESFSVKQQNPSQQLKRKQNRRGEKAQTSSKDTDADANKSSKIAEKPKKHRTNRSQSETVKDEEGNNVEEVTKNISSITENKGKTSIKRKTRKTAKKEVE